MASAILPSPKPFPLPRRAAWRRLAAPFAIDLRSLALFRVGLGAMVAADALLRWRDLEVFHTDAGAIPRRLVLAQDPAVWSLHLASGSVAGQTVLFGLHLLFALGLAAGWHTRRATALCFLGCVSVQQRTPFLLQGSDLLLTMLLFWSLFLPLGAVGSVDSLRYPRFPAGAGPGDGRYRWLSVGGAGLLLQVMSLYFFGALLKRAPEWRETGTAVFNAVRGTYGTPLGAWLAQFEGLAHPLTAFVRYLEFLAPFLVFCPVFTVPLRLAALAALYLMHLGFLLCLGVGQFPWVNFTALLLFIPGVAWDRLAGRWPGLSILGRKLAGRRRHGLPERGSAVSPAPRRTAYWSEALAAVCLAVMLQANFHSIWPERFPFSGDLKDGLNHWNLSQYWRMFMTVRPSRYWYLVEATDRQGQTAYLLNAARPWRRSEAPANVNDSYANYRWRKFLTNLWFHRNDPARRAFLDWVCRRHPEYGRVGLLYVEQGTRPETPPREYPVVSGYACAGPGEGRR